MRRLAPLLIALLAIPVADAAAANKATFKVSLYGVQRFEDRSTYLEEEGVKCFDERGTYHGESEVRFSTKRPKRVTVWLDGGRVETQWHGDGGSSIDVTASFRHSGSANIEQRSPCFEWKPKPELPPGDCDATIDRSYSVTLARSRISVVGGGGLVVPIDPFAGCQFGDLSADLYPAKQRFSIPELLANGKTEVILRGRDHSKYAGGGQVSETKKRTTVYVTFKKVSR